MTTSKHYPLSPVEYLDEDGQPMAEGDPQRNSLTYAVKVLLRSDVLGLDLRLEGDELRFYDPVTGNKLLSHEESEQARQAAETRVAELEAQLRALQEQKEKHG